MDIVEELLASVPHEGDNNPKEEVKTEVQNEAQTEKETPSEPPAEKKQEGQEPPQGGVNTPDEDKLPFHKHPRWKAKLAEIEDLKAQLADRPNREEIDQKVRRSIEPNSQTTQIPERFVKLYGDNPEAYKLWQEEMAEQRRAAREEWKHEQEQDTQAQQEAVKQGESFVKNALDELEDSGLKFDRNELMKFMLEVKEKYGVLPEDEEGNIDFHKGYELMQEMKKEKVEEQKKKSTARKELAGFTTNSNSRPESRTDDFVESKDIRHKGWDDLIRE